ncbi:MAG: amidohydrolase family protein [Gammaproteobacteria bacterium]|jgi:imidazolonepropionase-like amidohydrolase
MTLNNILSRKIITIVFALVTFVQGANAQDSDVLAAVQKLPPEMVSWADTVLYNGHIVTMDNNEISVNPGSIVEAMALRDGFVMKVGGNEEVRLMIGPDTRVMDLKGRTVLPGLIDTHAHPGPDATGLEVGQPGIHSAMLVDATADLTTKKLAIYLEEKIKPHRRPNEWVFIRLLKNPDVGVYEQGNVSHWVRAHTSVEDRFQTEEIDKMSSDFPLIIGTSGPVGKTMVDEQVFRENSDGTRVHLSGDQLGLVPDPINIHDLDDMLAAEATYHAYVKHGSHLATLTNSVATNIVEAAMPGWKEWLTANMRPGVDNAGERGVHGSKETQFLRSVVEPWTRDQQIQGMLQTMQRAGPWGVTSVYGLRGEPWKIDVHRELAYRGIAPVRYGMESGLHRNPMPFWEGVYLHARMGPMWDRLGPSPSGLQSMVWLNGINTERWDSLYPGACLGDDLPATDEIKAREICPDPSGDDLVELVFQEGLKAHWRLAGVHLVGSEAVRSFAKLHYNAIEAGYLTKEEVRNMRPAGAHGTVISAQPDIIEMVKDLNLLIPLNFNYMRMGNAWVRDYGPEIEDFILPARSYLDNGVKVYGEIHYGPIWPNLEIGVTRTIDGDTFGAHEAIDRVEALKMFTVWAAEWSFAEDISGSLEAGKWADYIILEKDILDENIVPSDELGDTVVLLTVLGDKVVYEHPSFNLEFN